MKSNKDRYSGMTKDAAMAFYGRVSTGRQVEKGESLETQLALAKQHIAKSDREITLYEYCDQGVSASKIHFTKRPELMRMLDDAKKGLFSTLLVFRRDRLARNEDEFFSIKYILIKANIKIIYLDPREINIKENDIYGNLIESVITSIAALEPKLISTRVKAVFREKALNGFWRTGRPPFGLYLDKDNDKSKSKLIPIPEEAEIVKKIFDYYINEKMGYRKIALFLNKENILFRNNQSIKKQWSISNIKTIINNPIYKGYIRLIEEDNSIKLIPCSGMDSPIIPPAIFDKANEIKKNRSNFSIKPREITTTFLLSNILYCNCGSRMSGIDNSYYYTNKKGDKEYKKYSYYMCGLKYQGKHQGICNFGRINAEQVHQIILEKCSELFLPSNYEKTRIKLIEKQNLSIEETKSKIKNLSRRISDLKRKIEVLLENLESSTQTHLVATYEDRLAHRSKELKKFQVELLNEKKYYNELKDKVWSIEEISAKLKDWREKIYDVESEVQRKMLLDVINKVQLNEEGEISIELKLSLDNLETVKEKGTHNNSYVYLFPLFN